MSQPDYAELHCLSNFSFLRGASHPQELIVRAAELGYQAMALTDECSMAGIVRAHVAARKAGIKLIVGSELRVAAASSRLKLVVLAPDKSAYAALCALITQGRRAATKGGYQLSLQQVEAALDGQGCLLLWLPEAAPDAELGRRLAAAFPAHLWIGVELLRDGSDRHHLAVLGRLAAQLSLPLVAAGGVHMHVRARRPLQDVLTAIRTGSTLASLGLHAYPNGERCLRPREELAQLYPAELLAESVRIAARATFVLDELHYQYPRELVPEESTPAARLRELTERGLRRRWPEGVSEKVRGLIEHELALIHELHYESYFLTVEDIVEFARCRAILCQGRGSAANSAVCYALGITEVDPARMSTLVERFISKERQEPPDIDVDFEHQRREEVIQYIYRKYSRERAALAATVITYRVRSAVRDVGKVLGFADVELQVLARSMHWLRGRSRASDGVAGGEREAALKALEVAGLDPEAPRVRLLVELVETLIGFPRHLSQHVGGFIISEAPLSQIVPVENASMPERTVIQWDKDDLEELGLLKVDILGLGMLSVIRRCLALGNRFHDRTLTLATIPAEDPEVYDMICRADTVGVFQIESRAQMAMLPRLRPRCYYDLVIEIALVRPGPIQGDMVHPYLKRRRGEEAVSYPSDSVREVLERTLGVPIFQEQVMKLAVVAAGFTPGEADQLRRSMAAWKRHGDLGPLEGRLLSGMRERGYSEAFAHRIYEQIKGFGEYGFPESHSASFALLVYVSAWLKCHQPAAFYCAMLNSQPMGFYAPAQLVGAAQRQGVTVLPVDVRYSDWESSLERGAEGNPAIRLGLQRVKGLAQSAGERLSAARADGAFFDTRALARRAALDTKALGALAASGALRGLSQNRYRARWDVADAKVQHDLLDQMPVLEGVPLLRRPTEGEDIVADYRHVGVSLGRHPLALLRARLAGRQVRVADELAALAKGTWVKVAGLVISRQRPSAAAGVVFVTLEDETGWVNLVIWKNVADRDSEALLASTLLGVEGRIQKDGEVLHVIAERLYDCSALVGTLQSRSRDFH